MEERHGVDIGASYSNNHGCATFVESIATDLQANLRKGISNSKFFSLLMDGSTDCSNVDEELSLVLYFDPHSGGSEDGMVHVRDKFFTVRQLQRGTGEGLYNCMKKALAYMGITPLEWKLEI